MDALVLERIAKSFAHGFLGRRNRVLRDVSLRLAPGEAFGLLGHNGAGKTTTMRIILGLLRPDHGRVEVFGKSGNDRETRNRIGYLGDEVGLHPFLTASETLQLVGELCRLPRGVIRSRSDELLEQVGLGNEHGLKVKQFSRGMRQRLGLAVALINDPDLLILDEPYLGLDPIGRRELRRLLLSLKDAGKTILLSSHIVPDVEAVCDRVGILARGYVQRSLSLREIYLQKSQQAEVTASGVDPIVFDGMQPAVELVYRNEQAIVLRCKGTGMVRSVISKIYAFGGDVLEVKPLRFNLEDYVLKALAESKKKEQKKRQEEMSYA